MFQKKGFRIDRKTKLGQVISIKLKTAKFEFVFIVYFDPKIQWSFVLDVRLRETKQNARPL